MTWHNSAMAVVPQEPLLVQGTVRDNLDPFGDYGTPELVRVLDRVGLAPSLLQVSVGEGAGLLNAGQRQLLTLSRVLLRGSADSSDVSVGSCGVRIVVLDEPTSRVDRGSDTLAQKAVRATFPTATFIVVAHR